MKVDDILLEVIIWIITYAGNLMEGNTEIISQNSGKSLIY
jgi:hypothetical protein